MVFTWFMTKQMADHKSSHRKMWWITRQRCCGSEFCLKDVAGIWNNTSPTTLALSGCIPNMKERKSGIRRQSCPSGRHHQAVKELAMFFHDLTTNGFKTVAMTLPCFPFFSGWISWHKKNSGKEGVLKELHENLLKQGELYYFCSLSLCLHRASDTCSRLFGRGLEAAYVLTGVAEIPGETVKNEVRGALFYSCWASCGVTMVLDFVPTNLLWGQQLHVVLGCSEGQPSNRHKADSSLLVTDELLPIVIDCFSGLCS